MIINSTVFILHLYVKSDMKSIHSDQKQNIDHIS